MSLAPVGQTLFAAAQEVLETMFFSSVYGESVELTPFRGVGATLCVEGRPSGRFALIATPGAARIAASNFLGKESEAEVTDVEAEQTMAELANMICGDALSRCGECREANFHLTSPEPIQALKESWTSGGLRRHYLVDGGALSVVLILVNEPQ
ncbi:MAG: chemotaxis protein CheX [Bryobacteraceae bacterium]